MFVKFVVTHEMSPISRLLVYYVRENGEGVADSFMFRVTPKYKNHVRTKLIFRKVMSKLLIWGIDMCTLESLMEYVPIPQADVTDIFHQNRSYLLFRP